MPIDMERLKQLLLVALSTDQPGEAMNALAAVRKLLTKDGKDIHWLAGTIGKPAAAPAAPAQDYDDDDDEDFNGGELGWEYMLAVCKLRLHELRPREQEFIESLTRQSRYGHWYPSTRQHDWLSGIYRRITNRR